MNERDSKSSVKRRRFLQTTGAAGGAVALAGTWPFRAHAAIPTFKLGQIAPFTGAAADYGRSHRDAAVLAVEHINHAAKEVFGGPIIARHIAADSKTLPEPAVKAARKLVKDVGVSAIIGGYSSGVTIATAVSVSIPSGVLHISNGSTSPLISILPQDISSDLLFRTTAPDTYQGVVLAQLLRGEIVSGHKFRTASTIFVNNPYGLGLSNAFARSFQIRGGIIQAQVPHPDEMQATYTAQLALALRDAPDILVAISYPGHTSAYLKEARDIFGSRTWAFVDGNKSEKVLEAIGSRGLAGSFGTAPGQDLNTPGFQNFATSFKKRFGRDRIAPFTESAYDAGITIGFAAAKAIVDGEVNLTGTVLRDRLRAVSTPPGEKIVGGRQAEILKGLKVIKAGRDVDYSGAAGECDFDKRGDVITPQAIWRFTKTGIETVKILPADKIPSE